MLKASEPQCCPLVEKATTIFSRKMSRSVKVEEGVEGINGKGEKIK